MDIDIVVGDITILNIDAIVNAANTALMEGGGVCGAIFLASGPRLNDACAKLDGCQVGDAKITPGFDLPAKWIVHTVGPVWRGGQQNEPQLLQSCYENSLKLAKVHQIKTIAFPAISTGIYGYPKREAAQIAIKTLRAHREDFDKVIACLFSEEDKALYLSVCNTLK